MEKPLWHGKPMKAWLYLGLQEALDKTIAMYKDICEEKLQELAEESGDSSIASLKLENGSLSRRYAQLKKDYDIGGFCLFDKIDRRKRGYEIFIEEKEFLTKELLPILKELEEGVKPTRMHQSIIEETMDKQHLFDFGILVQDWVPVALMPENTKITREVIKQFLDDLQQKIAKVTGIKQVFVPQPEVG